jgi:hypothetical protein
MFSFHCANFQRGVHRDEMRYSPFSAAEIFWAQALEIFAKNSFKNFPPVPLRLSSVS